MAAMPVAGIFVRIKSGAFLKAIGFPHHLCQSPHCGGLCPPIVAGNRLDRTTLSNIRFGNCYMPGRAISIWTLPHHATWGSFGPAFLILSGLSRKILDKLPQKIYKKIECYTI
jgi:hypothetical protein